MALLRDNEFQQLFLTLLKETGQEHYTPPEWVERLASSVLYLQHNDGEHEQEFAMQLVEAGYSLGAELANNDTSTYCVLNNSKLHLADYAAFFCTKDRVGLMQKLSEAAAARMEDIGLE